jgi:antitoxin component YwqK of YwqJK toxin-antitoxin module
MDGAWEGWFDNGQQDYKGEYQNGLKTGVWEHWYLNGQQELFDSYVIISKQDTSYLKDGNNKYSEFIKEELIPVQQGPHFSWYENGNPKDEGAYFESAQEGKWTYYFDTGKKMYEQTFVNGRQEGKVTSWYAIGTIQSEKNFKNNRPHGKFTFYSKKAGEVTNVMHFKNGLKVEK